MENSNSRDDDSIERIIDEAGLILNCKKKREREIKLNNLTTKLQALKEEQIKNNKEELDKESASIDEK